MLTTKNFLTADPWTAVIDRINDEYLTELQPFTTRLISMVSAGGTRTLIEIGPNQSESTVNTAPPIERTEYFYDRLDLATFFRVNGVKDLPGFVLPTNTFEILEQISELNEIVFTLNDFVHVQYDEYDEVYTLTANEKSLRFVGSFQFRLINTTRTPLQNLAKKLEFPLANTWPLGTDGTKAAGQYLVSGFNFTEEREFIKVLDKDSIWPSGRKLAAILQDVTGTPWVCTTEEEPFNICYDVLKGSPRVRVVYNGIVLPRYTPRTDIQRVCVLQLSDKSTNVAGYLLLHYN